MYDEDSLLPLSALQHLAFCERQAALIHIEGLWADNRLTVEGTLMHQSLDETGRRTEVRDGTRLARGIGLRSARLGLVGRADLVEFLPVEDNPSAGVQLPGATGLWRPFPVEAKRGRPKKHNADRVQLCAQGMCLEETFGIPVPAGALTYGKTRRRLHVDFDSPLRIEVEAAASRLHELIDLGLTPTAAREPKCDRCSLFELCMPHAISADRSATDYLKREIFGSARSAFRTENSSKAP
ncbi:MAG: CRISPR-associated protein Cas4 [Acidobacteriota bacterium]